MDVSIAHQVLAIADLPPALQRHLAGIAAYRKPLAGNRHLHDDTVTLLFRSRDRDVLHHLAQHCRTGESAVAHVLALTGDGTLTEADIATIRDTVISRDARARPGLYDAEHVGWLLEQHAIGPRSVDVLLGSFGKHLPLAVRLVAHADSEIRLDWLLRHHHPMTTRQVWDVLTGKGNGNTPGAGKKNTKDAAAEAVLLRHRPELLGDAVRHNVTLQYAACQNPLPEHVFEYLLEQARAGQTSPGQNDVLSCLHLYTYTPFCTPDQYQRIVAIGEGPTEKQPGAYRWTMLDGTPLERLDPTQLDWLLDAEAADLLTLVGVPELVWEALSRNPNLTPQQRDQANRQHETFQIHRQPTMQRWARPVQHQVPDPDAFPLADWVHRARQSVCGSEPVNACAPATLAAYLVTHLGGDGAAWEIALSLLEQDCAATCDDLVSVARQLSRT